MMNVSAVSTNVDKDEFTPAAIAESNVIKKREQILQLCHNNNSYMKDDVYRNKTTGRIHCIMKRENNKNSTSTVQLPTTVAMTTQERVPGTLGDADNNNHIKKKKKDSSSSSSMTISFIVEDPKNLDHHNNNITMNRQHGQLTNVVVNKLILKAKKTNHQHHSYVIYGVLDDDEMEILIGTLQRKTVSFSHIVYTLYEHHTNHTNHHTHDPYEKNNRMIGMIWYQVPHIMKLIQERPVRNVQMAILTTTTTTASPTTTTTDKNNNNNTNSHWFEEYGNHSLRVSGDLLGMVVGHNSDRNHGTQNHSSNTSMTTTTTNNNKDRVDSHHQHTKNVTDVTTPVVRVGDVVVYTTKQAIMLPTGQKGLDFQGRGRFASCKNIQLVIATTTTAATGVTPTSPSPAGTMTHTSTATPSAATATAAAPVNSNNNNNNNTAMVVQMVKWDTNTYHVDYQSPMNLLQAFGFAIAQLDL